MRVRNFTQDDAHIFCTEEQIQEEVSTFIDLVFEVYKTFGFDEIIIKLSTRPEKRVGSEEIWDKSEEASSDLSQISSLPTLFSGRVDNLIMISSKPKVL